MDRGHSTSRKRSQRRAQAARRKARVRTMVLNAWHQDPRDLTVKRIGKLASHHHTCGLCRGPRRNPHCKGAKRLSLQERRTQVCDTVPF